MIPDEEVKRYQKKEFKMMCFKSKVIVKSIKDIVNSFESSEAVAQEFLCAICLGFTFNPLTCNKCGKFFCTDDLSKQMQN